MIKLRVQAVVGFIYQNPDTVLGKSNIIGTNISANAGLFASLEPKIADGLVTIATLGDAVNRNDGSKLARLNVKNAVQQVQILMRKWAAQVTLLANGDVAVIDKSGFDNYKQPQPSPPVYTPGAVLVSDTPNSGIVKLAVPPVRFSDKYQYRYATKTNPVDSDFITLDPGKRVIKVKNLTPVTVYHFSCRVFGTDSVSDWNESIPWNVR